MEGGETIFTILAAITSVLGTFGCLGVALEELKQFKLFNTLLWATYSVLFGASGYYIFSGQTIIGDGICFLASLSGFFVLQHYLAKMRQEFEEHAERLKREYAEREKERKERKERKEKEEREERTKEDQSKQNNNQNDPYKTAHEVLGIRFGASLSEIKRAYKAKAKQCHPDLGGSEQQMKAINWAYHFLVGK